MKRKKMTIENGETISYFEQGTGSKVLLLLHGNVSSSCYFKPLFKRLPQDIKVIAPDLRGYGDSTYVNSFDSLKELAEDVLELLEKLKIETYVGLGWSLGGGVLMELALMSPKMEKMILVSSTSHRGYPIFKKDPNGAIIAWEVYDSKEELAKDPVQVLPMLQALESGNIELIKYIYEKTIYTVNLPEEVEFNMYAKEALKQRNLVDADWALASLNLSSESNGYTAGNGKIKQIEIPVLHIMGDKDYIVSELMFVDNYDALKPHSKAIRYESCGHSPFVDVPDTITKDILEYIAKTE